ncbi:GumC family protein [Calothrix sp. 336/3]|uniref:GumC family protein n=1 Tax=Calothrix sp. 336/3 TaxID=1337936 RepID=UPI000552448A|nr:tyrosine-protein kinase domain-containing protein [Calothrix sp. 336/3]AKG22008.1 lipopolysaccharide biosynthesis [Calothrix sp. 336/3]
MTPPIVKGYLISFEKYKWIGVAGFILVVAGSTVVAMQPNPPGTYLADAALSLTSPPVSFSATGSEIQQQGQTLSDTVLLSDPVIEAVATKLNIKPKQIGTNVAITLPKKTRTGELESPFIILKYKDSDEKRAKQVLQELMIAMVNLSREMNTGQLKGIIQTIDKRLPQAKKELQAAERRLEQYDRLEGPAILAAQNGSLLNGITISQNQQSQIQLTIAGIDAQIRSLQEKLGLNVSQAYVSSALSADPIINSLRGQIYQAESQMELLRKDLRPQHPNMVQLQRQKDSAEVLLRQRAAEVIGGSGDAAPLPNVSGIRTQSSLDPSRQQLANQMVALQTQKDTLKTQMVDLAREEKRLRQMYALIPNKQLERSRLEQEVSLKRGIYDKMQVKLNDAKAAEAETVPSIRIAKEPTATADIKPPKSVPTTLGVGGFLGLLLGNGVIFLLGSMEGIFKTKEDIRESLKQREVVVLGELPLLPADNLLPYAIPTILGSDSPYLEFYEKLRSNLRRMGGKNLKVLLVTSVGSAEGKTATAYNLGIACARAGKRTVIIETDLRSPSCATSLKVAPDPDSTLEPLRYYGSVSECIRLVPDVENLYIIPSPGPIRQAPAVIESSEMRKLMEDVRERYDVVILDTSPLGASNDTLLMQPYSDGMVLVARPNYTQESVFTEAVDQLTESNVGLLGGIINGADISVILNETIEEDREVKVSESLSR